MSRLKLLLVLALAILPGMAKADSFPVLDALKALPLKEGVMLDFQHQRVLNTLGIGVVEYEGFELDFAYVGVDGIGGVLDYSLGSLPVKNVPILSYVQYLNIGYGLGYRTLALNPNTDNPKSDSQLIHGPVLFCKLKF